MSNIPSSLWLGKLANLNVARTAARGVAPHKPLMLLSVIDLIEAGEIKDAFVPYQARLVSQFRSYWDLVLDRQRNRPDIAMPFNALGGDKDQVWERFNVDCGLWIADCGSWIVEQRSVVGGRWSVVGGRWSGNSGHRSQPLRGEIR